MWELHGALLRRIAPVSTLIEWNQDLPSLDAVLDEADAGRRLPGAGPDSGPRGGGAR